ncbi:hypothetical protein SEVIR_9G257000v4 [Setaria viridis]|uniref:Uncharacterized protein n=1 Tax=Setaria viridis TaxID=4556 RepID=A0A4U6SXZ4_SETVI|nr:hypothetical protein SEVIR_9G257000v2 [Setaria viridis]
MQQAEKKAAVAARDLLKAEVSRQRRAAAAQTRKAAVSSSGGKQQRRCRFRRSWGSCGGAGVEELWPRFAGAEWCRWICHGFTDLLHRRLINIKPAEHMAALWGKTKIRLT